MVTISIAVFKIWCGKVPTVLKLRAGLETDLTYAAERVNRSPSLTNPKHRW